MESEITLDDFKEELWSPVVKFEELALMGTGLDEKARKDLLNKMVKLRETRQKTGNDECKDSSTQKQKNDDKMIKVKGKDRLKTSNMIKDINILKARGGGRQEFLRIPAWKGSFDLVKRELETILEREILPTVVPEFPIVRRMTLGTNSPLMVPSLYARAMVEKQQQEFTDDWDPLFIGYTTAVYFHTCDTKINSWTAQAKKMRGSMPPKFEVRDILRTLGQANLDNMLPVWDDGRMIVREGHIALKDEMKFATRKYRAPYGLERVEMKHEEKEFDVAGFL